MGYGNSDKRKHRPIHYKSRTPQRKNNDNAHQNEIKGKTRIVINSHAPDMGNATEARKGYCGRIKQILYKTKEGDIAIWETDDGGQVRRNTASDEKTIGKWTTSKENSKGSGAKFSKRCPNNDLFIPNTF